MMDSLLERTVLLVASNSLPNRKVRHDFYMYWWKIIIFYIVQRELKYVTESLSLTPAEAKHWYYRIKREYEEEERIKKRL